MNEKNNKAPDKNTNRNRVTAVHQNHNHSDGCIVLQIRKVSCFCKAKKFFNLYFKVKSNQLTTTYIMTNI